MLAVIANFLCPRKLSSHKSEVLLELTSADPNVDPLLTPPPMHKESQRRILQSKDTLLGCAGKTTRNQRQLALGATPPGCIARTQGIHRTFARNSRARAAFLWKRGDPCQSNVDSSTSGTDGSPRFSSSYGRSSPSWGGAVQFAKLQMSILLLSGRDFLVRGMTSILGKAFLKSSSSDSSWAAKLGTF